MSLASVRLDPCEKKALKKALEGFKGEVYIFGSRLDLDTPFFQEILKNAKKFDLEEL